MDIQKMNREIGSLGGKLTPENRLFFEEVARHIRRSSLNEQKGEEALLHTLRQMLAQQERGRSMEKMFGNDPAAYAEGLLSDIFMRKPRTTKDKIRYYVFIPWIALTWVFFIYMVIGYLGQWSGGDFEGLHINTTTLLLIAVGSIVLIELVTRIMGGGGESNTSTVEAAKPRALKTEVKTLAITIAAAIIVLGIYVVFGHSLPTISASPTVCLIVFAVGFIGQFLLMPKKPKEK